MCPAPVTSLHSPEKVADKIRLNQLLDQIDRAISALLRQALTQHGRAEFDTRIGHLLCFVSAIAMLECGPDRLADLLAEAFDAAEIAISRMDP